MSKLLRLQINVSFYVTVDLTDLIKLPWYIYHHVTFIPLQLVSATFF